MISGEIPFYDYFEVISKILSTCYIRLSYLTQFKKINFAKNIPHVYKILIQKIFV